MNRFFAFFVTGPPIEIIHDYKAAVAEASREERVEEEVEDEAFAMVLQDAGLGDSPIPDGGTVGVYMYMEVC